MAPAKPYVPSGRPRGRPSKRGGRGARKPVERNPDTTVVQGRAAIPQLKKGRERPKKSVVTCSATAQPSIFQGKKGRGRPKKAVISHSTKRKSVVKCEDANALSPRPDFFITVEVPNGLTSHSSGEFSSAIVTAPSVEVPNHPASQVRDQTLSDDETVRSTHEANDLPNNIWSQTISIVPFDQNRNGQINYARGRSPRKSITTNSSHITDLTSQRSKNTEGATFSTTVGLDLPIPLASEGLNPLTKSGSDSLSNTGDPGANPSDSDNESSMVTEGGPSPKRGPKKGIARKISPRKRTEQERSTSPRKASGLSRDITYDTFSAEEDETGPQEFSPSPRGDNRYVERKGVEISGYPRSHNKRQKLDDDGAHAKPYADGPFALQPKSVPKSALFTQLADDGSGPAHAAKRSANYKNEAVAYDASYATGVLATSKRLQSVVADLDAVLDGTSTKAVAKRHQSLAGAIGKGAGSDQIRDKLLVESTENVDTGEEADDEGEEGGPAV